jgi:hypothetical protein
MAITRQITIYELVVIDKVFVKPVNDYRNNVVQTAHWTCKLIDDETMIEEKVSGSTYFQYPEGEFVEYSELTKATILSWLENHPDIDYRVSKIENRFNQRSQESNIPIIVNFDSLPDS